MNVRNSISQVAEAFAALGRQLAEVQTRRLVDETTFPVTLDAASHEVNVDAGVAFLDAKFGREFWLERIKLGTLDVASPWDCVVCQVTGLNFEEGMRLLGADPWHLGGQQCAFNHGFVGSDYVGLTHAWRQRVRALRNANSVRITA